MMQLLEGIPDRYLQQVTVFSEENNNVLFVLAERAG
jgi:hypothetical protein